MRRPEQSEDRSPRPSRSDLLRTPGWRRALLVVGAAAAVAVVSCSLLVDVNNLSGGPGPSDHDSTTDGAIQETLAVADTGVAQLDTFSPDGPGETEPDAEIGVPDSGVDTAPPVDGGIPCAQQSSTDLLFCDDFDTVTGADPMPGFDWEDHTVTGGSILIDKSTFLTSPNALKVVAPPNDGVLQLGKGGFNVGTYEQLSFDLRLDLDTLTGIAQTGLAQLYGDASARQFNLVFGPGKSCYADVYDESAPADAPPIATIDLVCPAVRTWTHVDLTYDATAGFTVSFNGAQAGKNATIVNGPPGGVTMIVGAPYVNSPGTTTMQFEVDNIVLRGK